MPLPPGCGSSLSEGYGQGLGLCSPGWMDRLPSQSWTCVTSPASLELLLWVLGTSLIKVKVESEKVGLKLNIQKMKIMSSGSIASRQIDGKQWKQCQTLFFGSKITADGDISHEIKRRLLLGRKVMTNLDSILKKQTLLC